MLTSSTWLKVNAFLFWVTLLALAAGISISTAFAPCSKSGGYITLAACAIALVTLVAHFVAAVRSRHGLWVTFAVRAAIVVPISFVAYCWTMLLCRGI